MLDQFRKTGSEVAFARMVETHIDMAYSVARRSVGDAHLAEDITQAVFMILAEKGPGLPEGTNLAGWVFRTTQYVAANARRTLRAARKRDEKYAKEHVEAVEDVMTDSDGMAALDRAMGKLSKADQDAVVMKYYRDASWQEVAAELGVSEEAARKRVGRSVAKLKQYLPEAAASMAMPAMLSGKNVVSAPSALKGAVISNFSSPAAANSTASLLAEGSMKMMRNLKMLKMTITTVGVLLLAGGLGTTLVLAGSKTLPTAEMTASASAPAVGADTPMEAAESFINSISAGDEEALKSLINSDTPQEREVVDMQAHMAHVVVLLQQSVRSKFGQSAVGLLPKFMGPTQFPENAVETITGDTATVSANGTPMSLVKVKGEWKVTYHTLPMTNLPMPTTTLVAWNEGMNKAIEEVTAEVSAGRLTDATAVSNELKAKVTAVTRELQGATAK